MIKKLQSSRKKPIIQTPNDIEDAHLLLHELSQPLMVINAYASGCILRLNEKDFDIKQIIAVMKIINEQVDRAGKLIDRVKDHVPVTESHYEKIKQQKRAI